MKMPYCKEQIKSYNRSVYTEQGDEVSIISLSGHVAIVQGKKGRFPMLIELLSDEPIIIEQEIIILRAPKSVDKEQLNMFGL